MSGRTVPTGQRADQSAARGQPPSASRRARRLAWLYAGAAVILLPWIGFLAVTLPKRQFDLHYRAAWVGFDVLLVFAIIPDRLHGVPQDQRVQFPATATATLLIVDAWFDMTTSGGHGQFFEAFVLAVLIEIPAAVFSIYLARQVNRRSLELAHLGRLRLRGPGRGRGIAARRARSAEPAADRTAPGCDAALRRWPPRCGP